MRPIPQNRIVENQYTNGTGIGKNLALRFVRSKVPYIGFYSIINGTRYFSGKSYTEKSKPLERYNIIEAAVGAIATAGSIATQANSLLGSRSAQTRYFYKDLTSPNILIKEIDKKAYDILQGKAPMTSQVISYNPNIQSLEDTNKQMPGLREFLVT
jgi:hypothetical protein